jgi:hypothetical protein
MSARSDAAAAFAAACGSEAADGAVESTNVITINIQTGRRHIMEISFFADGQRPTARGAQAPRDAKGTSRTGFEPHPAEAVRPMKKVLFVMVGAR